MVSKGNRKGNNASFMDKEENTMKNNTKVNATVNSIIVCGKVVPVRENYYVAEVVGNTEYRVSCNYACKADALAARSRMPKGSILVIKTV